MSSQAKQKQSQRLNDYFAVRSEKLKELRSIVQNFRNMNVVFAGAMQFRLVVDTNVVLRDIMWLVAKRTNETAKTQLMETIEAETIDVYAPPALFDEVEEKIPLLAIEKGLDVELMYLEWGIYKMKLKLAEPDSEKVRVLKNGIDPDDAEFIALAQTIAAHGVISNDKHIGLMGGNQISITCIAHLRDYSRSTAIELNIKVNGLMFGLASFAALQALLKGIKALIDGISKAPDWLKIALISGGVFIALHPGARVSVVRGLKTILAGIGEATPFVIQQIAEAAELAQKHQTKAQGHLELAMIELGKNEVAIQPQ